MCLPNYILVIPHCFLNKGYQKQRNSWIPNQCSLSCIESIVKKLCYTIWFYKYPIKNYKYSIYLPFKVSWSNNSIQVNLMSCVWLPAACSSFFVILQERALVGGGDGKNQKVENIKIVGKKKNNSLTKTFKA